MAEARAGVTTPGEGGTLVRTSSSKTTSPAASRCRMTRYARAAAHHRA